MIVIKNEESEQEKFVLETTEGDSTGEAKSDFEKETEEARKVHEEILSLVEKIADEKKLSIEQDKKNELIKIIQETKVEAEQLDVLIEALVISNEVLPAEIENLDSDSKKTLKTQYVEKKSEQDSEKLKRKIEVSMEHSLATVSSALSKNEYPWGIIGSNAFVLEAGDKTIKIPDDIDAVAVIQDFPIAYSEFKKLENSGKISELQVIPITTTEGQKNDCYEIRGNIINENKKNISFSIFFQNIHPQKENNGYVNIGKEDTIFHKYEIELPTEEKIEVNFASKETSEILYLKNTLNEIRLFMFEVYKMRNIDFPHISPKSMQRLSNLAVLNDQNFDKVLELLDKIDDEQHAEQFNKAKELLKELRKEFVGKKAKAGKGLGVSICVLHNITENVCAEKAVDILNKEVQKEMQDIDKIYDDIEEKMNSDISKEDKKQIINDGLEIMKSKYNEYLNKIRQINNNEESEFTLFIAMKSLKNDFLTPVIDKLILHKKQLEIN